MDSWWPLKSLIGLPTQDILIFFEVKKILWIQFLIKKKFYNFYLFFANLFTVWFSYCFITSAEVYDYFLKLCKI